MFFRWNDWNLVHVTSHGVSREEVETLIQAARGRYPRKIGEDKWLVRGRGKGGRLIQAIFVLDEDDCIFVIHARPLNKNESRRFRRKKT